MGTSTRDEPLEGTEKRPAGDPGGVFTKPGDFPKAEFHGFHPVHKTSVF